MGLMSVFISLLFLTLIDTTVVRMPSFPEVDQTTFHPEIRSAVLM
jgi:hypothetical protein